MGAAGPGRNPDGQCAALPAGAGRRLALDRTPAQVFGDLCRVADRMGDIDPQRVMALVLRQKCQVFPLPHGSVVGCMMQDGRAHLLAGGGSLSEILAAEPLIALFYRDAGARRLSLAGRKGWRRVLAPLGWHVEGDLLVKELTG